MEVAPVIQSSEWLASSSSWMFIFFYFCLLLMVKSIFAPSGTKQRGFSASPSRSLPTMHKRVCNHQLFYYVVPIEY